MKAKIDWKLSEVNIRAVSRGQNELIGEFQDGKYFKVTQKEETFMGKKRDLRIKGTNKHKSLINMFHNHICLSQSEENECM
jgi:hypothetical protein